MNGLVFWCASSTQISGFGPITHGRPRQLGAETATTTLMRELRALGRAIALHAGCCSRLFLTVLVPFLLVVGPLLAWFGILAGIAAAKLLRQPIRRVWVDAILGVSGFFVGMFGYIRVMQPVNGVGANECGVVVTCCLPIAHQWLRSLIATSRSSSS